MALRILSLDLFLLCFLRQRDDGCCCKISVVFPLLLSVAITAFASTDKENKSERGKSWKTLGEEKDHVGTAENKLCTKNLKTEVIE